jgi:hypothetical protein
MFIGWGADHILLYNDGYAPMLADRHPLLLAGRSLRCGLRCAKS